MKYNIMDPNGRIMLGCWVQTEDAAKHYRQQYINRYGTGTTPYPNGKGVYPDMRKLRIVCSPSPRDEMEG